MSREAGSISKLPGAADILKLPTVLVPSAGRLCNSPVKAEAICRAPKEKK